MRLRHKINPRVDCVFKALFADPERSDLLIDLLNCVLGPEIEVCSVELMSPIVPEAFVGDDSVVVDVLAQDRAGRTFQVEMQALVRPSLPGRMLYTWADIFQHQAKRGKDYAKLNPVISIWLLGEALYPESSRWHHTFRLQDIGSGLRLTDLLRIEVIELAKWRRADSALAGAGRWVYFLNNAKDWNELPEELADPVMRRAMSVLEQFSELEKDYLRYSARLDELRERETWRSELEFMREERDAVKAERDAVKAEVDAVRAEADAVRAEADAVRAEADAVRAEADAARAESEAIRAESEAIRSERDRLVAALRALGIDPDAP